MGGARSQLANRVPLGRRPNLRLERPPLGDVIDLRDEILGPSLGVAMDGHADPRPHEAAVSPSISFFIDHVVIPRPGGHLTHRFGFTSHLFRPHVFLNGKGSQLFARVSQQIAEALIDPQPLSIEALVHDPDWRCVNVER